MGPYAGQQLHNCQRSALPPAVRTGAGVAADIPGRARLAGHLAPVSGENEALAADAEWRFCGMSRSKELYAASRNCSGGQRPRAAAETGAAIIRRHREEI